jgi:hypothetical protein
VLAALAILTKYTGALVIPVLVAWSIMRRRWSSLGFVVVPVSALGLWLWHNRALYGRSHLWSLPMTVSGIEPAVERLTGVLVGHGAITILSLLVFVALSTDWLKSALVVAASVSQVALVLWSRSTPAAGWSATYTMHYVAFATSGALMWFGLVALQVCRGWSKEHASVSRLTPKTVPGDTIVLSAWAVLFVIYNSISVPFLAVRHLLPGIAPLVWLVLREWDIALPRSKWKHASLVCTVAISTALGYALAVADLEFATAYRQLPQMLSEQAAQGQIPKAGSHRIWHDGVMGWAYYAELAGLRGWWSENTDRLLPGDAVVLSERAGRSVKSAIESQRMESICTRQSLHGRVPLRTIASGVQYYAFDSGLPWRFSLEPLDTIKVITVAATPGNPNDPAHQRRNAH